MAEPTEEQRNEAKTLLEAMNGSIQDLNQVQKSRLLQFLAVFMIEKNPQEYFTMVDYVKEH